MKHSTIRLFIILMLNLVWLTSGCQQTAAPKPEQEIQVPVVKAAIAADCIAIYYRQGSAPYYTEQQHRYNPASGYLQIIAEEPTGKYSFTLMKNDFRSDKKKTSFLSDLPGSFVSRPLATSLFYSFSAGAGLLDTDTFTTTENVKIEGQWYQPMVPPRQTSDAMITLLKNLNTNRIELVMLSQEHLEDSNPELEVITETQSTQWKWLLKSYNYRYLSDLDTLVPTKFDVFDIQRGLASKRLIIQFEYKTIVKQ